MPRAAATTDVFYAVAETRRREIIGYLASRERTVNELVKATGLGQSTVSKHLQVLKQVGVVAVRAAGNYRYYRLDALKLKPVHDWVRIFERLWNEQFDKLEAYLAAQEETERPHA
jgi:DNA-binding transcriptional ArsR family regulator